MGTELRIPYSRDQWDCLVDSCLYGMSYGYVVGEDEYIEAELKKLGYAKGQYRVKAMDDKKYEHVIEV